MNIALVLQHKLLLGIQRFMHGGRCAAVPTLARALPEAAYQSQTAVQNVGAAAPGSRHMAEKIMPLRVLRVVESGMPRSSAGRLVISGRMADVCAELDRLVEREAALH
jgi:hypothetical protein